MTRVKHFECTLLLIIFDKAVNALTVDWVIQSVHTMYTVGLNDSENCGPAGAAIY